MAIAKFTPSDFILPNGKPMTPEQMAAKVNAATAKTITFKVSELGAMSAYGMGRFPITLYPPQWRELICEGPTRDAALAYLDAHASEFSQGKDDTRFDAVKAKRAAEKKAKSQ